MKENNQINNPIDEASFEDDLEEFNGICDDISGTPISSFNFTKETISDEIFNKPNITAASPSNNSFTHNPRLKTQESEIIPIIDEEPFDTQRCYKIRNSTARMLNEIKAIHPDVNVYMNTIVDAAIRNYYDYIFNKDGIKTL